MFGDLNRTDGWQTHTDYKDTRGGLRLDAPLPGGAKLSLGYTMFLNDAVLRLSPSGRSADRRGHSRASRSTTTTNLSAPDSTTGVYAVTTSAAGPALALDRRSRTSSD